MHDLLVDRGIGEQFHEEPRVPNFGKPRRGTKLAGWFAGADT